MILESHTVHDPWTMVVVPSDACAAQHTMLRSQRALWGRGTPHRSAHWLSFLCPGMLGAPWLARQGTAASNPFDRGCLGNWLSFVSRGQYDRIDYTCLYDVA